MENNNEKNYAEYDHDNKKIRLGGKPAIIVSMFTGMTLLGIASGITYTVIRNPEAAKEVAKTILK
ncbi:hypothetical protein R0K17_11720 [Planococcus sp. SIMBA_143]